MALIAEAVLLILGYALVMPVLLSSFDGAPNDATLSNGGEAS